MKVILFKKIIYHDLIQNETPVHFLYGIRKTAHPDRVRSSLHNNRY